MDRRLTVASGNPVRFAAFGCRAGAAKPGADRTTRPRAGPSPPGARSTRSSPRRDALVAGASATSNAHVTVLDGFAPLKDGAVTLVLRGACGQEESFRQDKPKRDGIYPVEVKPRAEGTFDLVFRIESAAGREDVAAGRVRVGSAAAPGGLAGEEAPAAADAVSVPQGAAVADRVRDRVGPRGRARRERRGPGAGEGGGRRRGRAHRRRRCDRRALSLAPRRAGPRRGRHRVPARAPRRRPKPAGAARRGVVARGRGRRRAAPRRAAHASCCGRGHEPGRAGAGPRDARRPRSAARLRAGRRRARRTPPAEGCGCGGRRPGAVGGTRGRGVGLPGPDRGRGRAARPPRQGRGRSGSSWRSRPADATRIQGSPRGLFLRQTRPARRRSRSTGGVKLVSRAPEVDPRTASVSVLLEVDRSASELPLGSAVEAEILLPGEKRGIVVPLAAVLDDCRRLRRLRAARGRELRPARGARAAAGSATRRSSRACGPASGSSRAARAPSGAARCSPRALPKATSTKEAAMLDQHHPRLAPPPLGRARGRRRCCSSPAAP